MLLKWCTTLAIFERVAGAHEWIALKYIYLADTDIPSNLHAYGKNGEKQGGKIIVVLMGLKSTELKKIWRGTTK